MSKFKVGDKVTVLNASWGRNLVHSYSCHIDRCRRDEIREFKVLAVDCAIPVDAPDRTANTLIMWEKTGDTYAVNDCNLQRSLVRVEVVFTIGSQIVTKTLNREDKREVLREFLEMLG